MTPPAESTKRSKRTALVLSGGGARGAYQVGVLRGLADLGLLDADRAAIDTFVGSSAGAINSSMMAAHADDPSAGVDALEAIWRRLQASDVFRTDVRSVGSTGIKWAWDLTFGGAVGGVTAKSLLDTAPLGQLLDREFPLERLDSQVERGSLHALAIAATDLATADGVLFIHGRPDIELWTRKRWQIETAHVTTQHVLASSAIPIFFPSVRIGDRHFGDGSIRNTAPLSPAINLGAERIVAVSVRGPSRAHRGSGEKEPPTIAQIAGVLLDAVMLDAIEVDIDHSERVNRSVVSYEAPEPGSPFRRVDVLWIQPSAEFTAIAAELAHEIPAVVRYLMRGLGSEEATNELSSYLLFAPEFASRLIEIGRADVQAARAEIEGFFEG